jgi:V/A-type H+/Na+-transporting ATPase subunit I
MRYDVNKYLFVGFEGERESFFKRAQELGIIHFIRTKSAKVSRMPEDAANLVKAIKIIKSLPPTAQEDIEEYALADGLVEKVLQLKQTEDKLAEEARILKLEMARVQIFGDFSIEDIAYVEKETHRKAQFFCAKVGFADLSTLPLELIFVGSDNALDYFMALNKEPKQYPKMIEIHIERPLGVLLERQREIKEGIRHAEQRLKVYAKYNKFFHHALVHKLNTHHLYQAKDNAKHELDGSLFAIEGWVPVSKVKEMIPFVENANVHVEQIAIESNDAIPTYLENSGASRLGEDLINIYDTPSHTDKDPSLWVLVFFAMFFAFIVGDGGYGLIFLAAALYVRYKYKHVLDKTWTRVVNLLTILSAAVLIWGVLTTSFFGIPISMDSPLRKVSLLQWLVDKKTEYIIKHQDEDWKEWVKKFPQLTQVKDPKVFLKEGATHAHGKTDYVIYNKFADNIMFELAIMIGVVHIILSMLRNLKRSWNGYGWILFIIGSYLYFPYYLNVTSIIHFVFGLNREAAAQNGIYMMIGGISLATFLAIVQHKFAGLMEPMAVGQIFADSMSYLRLYALGLSGAMLTSTINDLAGGMNFVIGALIIILGHIVNMVLSIMGGTIHGLRLNFLEWYHYSFEGGGKPFDPLRKMEIE